MMGRSSLTGVPCAVVGYAFTPHPQKPEPWWVQVTVYYNKTGLVLCTSEGSDPPREMVLGGIVPGERVAPFAQRHIGPDIDQATFDEMKRLLSDDMPFKWLDKLPALP